jgi:putative spermidine/putrescine transport system substrate-binding protein
VSSQPNLPTCSIPNISLKLVPSGNISRSMPEDQGIRQHHAGFTKGRLPNGQEDRRPGHRAVEGALPEGANSKKFSTTHRIVTPIPTVYNADTLGIRPDLIKRPISS